MGDQRQEWERQVQWRAVFGRSHTRSADAAVLWPLDALMVVSADG
jgi:hypothetical protein